MEDLIQPSLQLDEKVERQIFSPRATFFVAFFGGAIPGIIFSALNSHLLGRLKKDMVLFLLLVLSVLACYSLLFNPPEDVSFANWFMDARRTSAIIRFGPRGIALAVWAVIYFAHSPYHKAARLMGLEYKNGWLPGIICLFGAGILDYLLKLVAVELRWLLL